MVDYAAFFLLHIVHIIMILSSAYILFVFKLLASLFAFVLLLWRIQLPTEQIRKGTLSAVDFQLNCVLMQICPELPFKTNSISIKKISSSICNCMCICVSSNFCVGDHNLYLGLYFNAFFCQIACKVTQKLISIECGISTDYRPILELAGKPTVI